MTQHKSSRYSLDPKSKPIEDRMVSFDHKPTEEELSAAIGYPLMGSGSTIKWLDGRIEVVPQKIPIRLATYWMYFVIAVMVALTLYFSKGRDVKVPLFMIGFGAVVIVPFMMGILSWINSQTGSEPYLVYDTYSSMITLPRLELSFPKEQVEMLVSLERFVDENEYYQTAILIRQEERWLYAHVLNRAEESSELINWKFTTLPRRIAKEIGVELIALRFNRKKSRLLD